MHWQTIAERLADRHPEHYAYTTAEAVSALLRPYVRSVQVKVSGVNNRGTRKTDLDIAIKARKGA